MPSSFAAISPAHRRRVARIAALTAACAAWIPSSTEAADVGGAVGPYVSFTFGDEVGVGYGLDAVVLVAPGDSACSDRIGDGWGIGPSFQLGAINASVFQLVFALAGGGGVPDEDGLGLIGEAGVVMQVSKEGTEAGVHTGLAFQSPAYAHGFVRAEWLLDSYSVGGGARFPKLFNREATCQIGRPWRDARGAVVARGEAAVGGVVGPTESRAEDPEGVARAWTADVQGEAASVPAFLQLACDLVAHGAPEALVDAALDAAEDEVRHARLCASIASRLAGRRVVPALPSTGLRPPLAGREGVARLAVESWVDGCLGEGSAAARARYGARHATDDAVACAQATIARDEARHAELGWQVLAWAAASGGRPVVDAVRAVRGAATPGGGSDDVCPADARRFGRVLARDVEALHAAHASHARQRLDALVPG